MAQAKLSGLAQLLADHDSLILADWMTLLRENGATQTGRISEAELQTQARSFLTALRNDLAGGNLDSSKSLLSEISRTRALQGFTPSEMASFTFSLKQPIFHALNRFHASDAATVAQLAWDSSTLLDNLGLFTMEAYQTSREEVIVRQQREIAELSTPVVKLWDGILALPLIGTLDSERTQVVMESLLQSIVEQSAEIAIIDITGVPTVDTLTAQHLLKTVAAARLMGADCIVSGIRPQIAQTMVHLGVELNVISKSTLADAFAVALRRVNRAVVPIKAQPPAANSAAAV